LEDSDKKTIKEALKESQEWLDKNASADKEDFESQLKDLQAICDPIVSKVYKNSGGAGGAGGAGSYEEESDAHDDL
jgi:hypothetical protein